MRFTILALLLLFASFCWGNPTLFNNYGSGDPGVIGNWLNYDIKSASLSVAGSSATLTLLFNYGFASGASWSSTTLGQFTDAGLKLNVGDAFFYDPSSPQTYTTAAYGIDIVSHGSGASALDQGDLYSLAAANGTLTASSVLGSPTGVKYRPDTAVWINTSASPTDVGAGTVSISSDHAGGPTASDPLLKVVVTFSTAGVSLFSGGNIGFQFEAATCANDIIQGQFSNYYSPTPEPSSLALAAGGLLLAAIGLIRRKRSV
jgi:PEP-CTERM motif